jgi:hypothetical protein
MPPLPDKPLLKFEVHISDDKIIEIQADTVEIYEAGVPTFYKKGKIIAAFNVYDYFILPHEGVDVQKTVG